MNVTDSSNYSPYAPVRNQKQTWWVFSEHIARGGWVRGDGCVSGDINGKIREELIAPSLLRLKGYINQELSDASKGAHFEGTALARLLEMHDWVPLAAQFSVCGRQIFDLTDEVVELLEHTDFGDCTLEGLHLPYEAFFVRFGKREAIHLPFDEQQGFEYLDGAFVATTPCDEQGNLRLKLGFSTCKKSGEGVMLPGYFLDFTPEEQAMPVVLAIDHAITRRINRFLDSPDDAENVKAVKAHRRDLITEGGQILNMASSLIVNALFYIESVGTQRHLELGRDAPTDYTVLWEQSDPVQREKLKLRMLADGYTAVYLLGREFSSSNSVAHGGHRRTHWRRGHWRRQHHGQANSLIKRKWIKPQLIGAKSEEDLTGHIYVVGNPESPDTKH